MRIDRFFIAVQKFNTRENQKAPWWATALLGLFFDILTSNFKRPPFIFDKPILF